MSENRVRLRHSQSPSGPDPPPPLSHRGQITASGAGPGLKFPWDCSESPKHFQGPKERQVEASDPQPLLRESVNRRDISF